MDHFRLLVHRYAGFLLSGPRTDDRILLGTAGPRHLPLRPVWRKAVVHPCPGILISRILRLRLPFPEDLLERLEP